MIVVVDDETAKTRRPDDGRGEDHAGNHQLYGQVRARPDLPAMTPERLDLPRIGPMTRENTSPYGTAFMRAWKRVRASQPAFPPMIALAQSR
jgi:hypothetical protein